MSYSINADLHIHTNASSDALMSPEDVVSIALSNGVKAIAITDHNSINGIERALQAGKKMGVEVVPGVELAAICDKAHLHLTGLFINHKEPSMIDYLSNLKFDRDIYQALYHTVINPLQTSTIRKSGKRRLTYQAICSQLKACILIWMGFPVSIEQTVNLITKNTDWWQYLVESLIDNQHINENDEGYKQKIKEKIKIINYHRYKVRHDTAEQVISVQK